MNDTLGTDGLTDFQSVLSGTTLVPSHYISQTLPDLPVGEYLSTLFDETEDNLFASHANNALLTKGNDDVMNDTVTSSSVQVLHEALACVYGEINDNMNEMNKHLPNICVDINTDSRRNMGESSWFSNADISTMATTMQSYVISDLTTVEAHPQDATHPQNALNDLNALRDT